MVMLHQPSGGAQVRDGQSAAKPRDLLPTDAVGTVNARHNSYLG
jgi:hypothetical protein